MYRAGRGPRNLAAQHGAHGPGPALHRSRFGANKGTAMEIRPIRTKADHRAALKEIESRMDARAGTSAGARLDVLSTLVESIRCTIGGYGVLLLLPTLALAQAPGAAPGPTAAAMQAISGFAIDRTEVTIGQFRRFAEATGTLTRAEREGGGQVYEAGWTQKPGWTWRAPFGTPGGEREPAVHLTYAEAEAYCRWTGKRLPTDREWVEAAYTERRARPPAPFVTGRTYPTPQGDSPAGANCLEGCGQGARPVAHGAKLLRGRGHVEAGASPPGVNGLHDMGGNAWEWVDSGEGAEKRTRGGSWWYGVEQMRADHLATKPAGTAVVYIGFRCAVSR